MSSNSFSGPDIFSEVELHDELIELSSLCSRYCLTFEPKNFFNSTENSKFSENSFANPIDRALAHRPCIESCAKNYILSHKFLTQLYDKHSHNKKKSKFSPPK